LASAQQTSFDQSIPERTQTALLAGYFPQWGIYSNYFVKNVVTSGSAPILTHLQYAFANVVNDRCKSFDPGADYQDPFPASETVNGKPDSKKPGAFVGNFHQLQELKQLFPKLKVTMSIGGASVPPSAFSSAAAPENREAFVASCVQMYIEGYFAKGLHEPGIFDGLDIDWEFPGPGDTKNVTALMQEFRRQLDAVQPGLILTWVGGAGKQQFENVELSQVQQSIDFFNVETYDYDGPWSNETGFVAPLYKAKRDPDPTNNADYSIRAYLNLGVLPQKIAMGFPFYGYEWTDVNPMYHGLFEDGTPVSQSSAYNYIVTIEKNYSKFRDATNQEPWLFDGSAFWTYDDPVSLRFKVNYAKAHGLGGAMVWELSSDTANGTLLKTISHALGQGE